MAVNVEKKGEERTPATTGAQSSTPTHPIAALRQEMDRLFDSFFTMPFGRRVLDLDPFREWMPAPITGEFTPRADVRERGDAYEITAELPGLAEDDISVTLEDRLLTIKGEKKEVKDEKHTDYFISERRFGSFARSFRLPDDVEAEKIDASYSGGVLTLTLPKSRKPQKEVRKIQVKPH